MIRKKMASELDHSKIQKEKTLSQKTSSELPSTGKIVSIDEQGQLWIDFPENSEENPILADFTRSISPSLFQAMEQHSEVLLLWQGEGFCKRPVVVEILASVLDEIVEQSSTQAKSSAADEEQSSIVVPSYLTKSSLGTLVQLDSNGQIWVDFPENPDSSPVVASYTSSVARNNHLPHATRLQRDVLLLFRTEQWESPVIIDIIIPFFDPSSQGGDSVSAPTEKVLHNLETETEKQPPEELIFEADRIRFVAKEKIVTECGDSSVTLSAKGKVLTKGNNVISYSRGPNKIKGGSVQIN